MNRFLFELLMMAVWLLVFSCLYRIFLSAWGSHFRAVWRSRIWRVIVFGLPIICLICGLGKKSVAKYAVTYVGMGNGERVLRIGEENVVRTVNLHFPVSEVLLIVWAMGVLLYLVCQLYRHWMFCDFCSRHKRPIQQPELATVWKQMTGGLARRPEVAYVKGISTPILMGFFRPCIYLPDMEYNPKELELILQHELCHYCRHDLFWQFAWLLVCSAFWFHPLMPFLAVWMERECESACDEIVLNGKNDAQKQMYCEMLIRFLRIRNGMQSVLTTGFSRTGKHYRKRLEEILGRGRRQSMYFVLCMAVVLMISCQGIFQYVSAEQVNQPKGDNMSTEWIERIEDRTVYAQTSTLSEEGGTAVKDTVLYIEENYSEVHAEW